MKAYKVELMVLDFDNIGSDGIKEEIENTKYGNRCINPKVVGCEDRDIGDWSDDHPLNQRDKSESAFLRLFMPNKAELATQESAIFGVLVDHCGQTLTPDKVKEIWAKLLYEMRDGPCSWAFIKTNSVGSTK